MKTRLSIIGTAAAFALALAPAGLSAGIHPDDRALPRATGPDLVPSLHPDDRAVPRAASSDLVSSLHPDDRALPFASSANEPSAPPTLVRVANRGFDWTDFGVGAMGGFGIALALMGATLIVPRLAHREARPT